MTEFLESFVIILREGLEAILIVAALIAYLVKTNHLDKVKTVYWGAGIAIVASLITAFLLELFFASADAPKEILEGATMLLAAVVMLYVTNWFVGKLDSAKWTGYIKGKMNDALTNENAFALGIVSFLAVYREGFETVLFYKALTVGTADLTGAFLGLVIGLVVLAVLFIVILRIEKRLPLGIVFGFTSAILFLLSLKFAGKGIHELQEAHLIPETALNIVPRIADLGIYPYVETLAVQGIVLLFGLAMVYFHFYAKKENKVSKSR
ncbi:MAG TPA: FTR1 family protein [archaeon]|nr:FTR1 family protein [archaeon]